MVHHITLSLDCFNKPKVPKPKNIICILIYPIIIFTIYIEHAFDIFVPFLFGKCNESPFPGICIFS